LITERTLFWRTRNQGAMRSGKWKYLRAGTNEVLYELSADEHEQANYADLEPNKLAELRAAFKAWESQMMSYPKVQG